MPSLRRPPPAACSPPGWASRPWCSSPRQWPSRGKEHRPRSAAWGGCEVLIPAGRRRRLHSRRPWQEPSNPLRPRRPKHHRVPRAAATAVRPRLQRPQQHQQQRIAAAAAAAQPRGGATCLRAELAAEHRALHGGQVALLGVVARQVEVGDGCALGGPGRGEGDSGLCMGCTAWCSRPPGKLVMGVRWVGLQRGGARS